jgi:cellulose synthase/poly-beta-1,6-N-acetylglucosamine synthase-like glycosyltransferase
MSQLLTEGGLMFEEIGNLNPQITIVIPAYNHARYLPEYINSVLNQTHSNIELIVLDGNRPLG